MPNPMEGQQMKYFVDTDRFNIFMANVVMTNAVLIGIETDMQGEEGAANTAFSLINDFFLLIYLAELGMRFFYHGTRTLNDGFNNFDLCLVSVSAFERVFFADGGAKMLPVLRIIRLVRLVRLVRLLRFFRELWLVVAGLMSALSTLGWVAFLLLCLIWVCAIFCQMVIGESTAWLDTFGAEDTLPIFMYYNNFEYFGSVQRSSFTLFQVVTLSQWAQNVVRPVIEKYAVIFIFFLFFIFLTTYGLLNVVVANLVNDAIISSAYNEQAVEGLVKDERDKLCKKIGQFFAATDTDGDGTLNEAELARAMKLPKLRQAFQMLGVPDVSPSDLLKTIDKDGSGSVSHEEFVQGILKMRGETGPQDLIMLMLQVNGLTTRVQELEKRLDRLATNVHAVKDALQFALGGVRAALYKAEYVEMRSKQLEVAKVGENKTLTAVFESDEPKTPPGERESLESFAKRLFGPGQDGLGMGVTIAPPKDDGKQGSPNRGRPKLRYPVSPTTTWGGKPGEQLPDAPSRESPVRTPQQEQALLLRARQRQQHQPSPQSIRRLVVPLRDLPSP